MIIEEQDFRIIPVNSCSSLFDLELLYIVNKGKDKERTEFRNVGYGMTLDTVIKKIVMNRINNKFGEGSISLKEFLKEFKEGVKEIKKLCED